MDKLTDIFNSIASVRRPDKDDGLVKAFERLEKAHAQVDYPSSLTGFTDDYNAGAPPLNLTNPGRLYRILTIATFPAGWGWSENRYFSQTIKLGNVQGGCGNLPYIEKVFPEGCNNHYPLTPEAGWEEKEDGRKVLLQHHVFRFTGECIPAKTFKLKISMRGFTFGPGDFGTHHVIQGNAGVTEIPATGLTLEFPLSPTCEGAPRLETAPPRDKN